MPNFNDMISSVLDEVNRPGSEPGVNDRARRAINDAIIRLQRRQAFRLTERLFRFTYPANSRYVRFGEVCGGLLRDLYSVSLIPTEGSNAGVVLETKKYTQIIAERKRYQDSHSTRSEVDPLIQTGHGDYVSRVHSYDVFYVGDQIGLYPTPAVDVNLELHCHVWLPPLVEDEDTNFFLDYAYDLVRAMAVNSMATYLRNPALKTMSIEDETKAIDEFVAWDSQIQENAYGRLT